MKFYNSYYYTLKDWFDYIGYDDWSSIYEFGITNSTLLKAMLNYKYGFTTELNAEPAGSTYANILFSKYILPRYRNCYIDRYIIKYDDEPDATEIADNYKAFTADFINVLNLTYERYSKLIELYEANKSDLLNELTTETISRFNDTPQDGGLYADDEYTTNVTQSESKTNVSILSRLAELDNTIKNLYTEWSNEFRKVFIYV